MKILVTGSHGVGKSTLSFLLAAHLKLKYRDKSVKVIEESIRDVSKIFNGVLNTPEFQKYVILDSICNEIKQLQSHQIVICDRTSIDPLVYGMMFGVKLSDEFTTLAVNNLNTFTKIIYIKPDNTPIVDDGFRMLDVEDRNKIDLQFNSLLQSWGGSYKVINTSEVETVDCEELLR